MRRRVGRPHRRPHMSSRSQAWWCCASSAATAWSKCAREPASASRITLTCSRASTSRASSGHRAVNAIRELRPFVVRPLSRRAASPRHPLQRTSVEDGATPASRNDACRDRSARAAAIPRCAGSRRFVARDEAGRGKLRRRRPTTRTMAPRAEPASCTTDHRRRPFPPRRGPSPSAHRGASTAFRRRIESIGERPGARTAAHDRVRARPIANERRNAYELDRAARARARAGWCGPVADAREPLCQRLAAIVVRGQAVALARLAHGDAEDERQPVEIVAHSRSRRVGSDFVGRYVRRRREKGQGQCEWDGECRAHVASDQQAPCRMCSRDIARFFVRVDLEGNNATASGFRVAVEEGMFTSDAAELAPHMTIPLDPWIVAAHVSQTASRRKSPTSSSRS